MYLLSYLLLTRLLLPTTAPSQPHDHVIITSEMFVSSFIPLEQLVEEVLGLSDTTVTVEDIYAQYPGRDNPEKIRNFIRYAYENWGTTYILLGGDVEIVPHRNVRASRLGRTGDIPCDLYYSALDGDWDANRNGIFGEVDDSVDLIPDVFIGRLPISTAGELDTVVSKVVAYCSDSSAPYLRRVLLTGFDLYQNPPIHGEIACEYYDQFLVPSALKPCTKVYDSHTGNHRDSVLTALNQGQHIWVHADHGNWDRLGTGVGNHGWVIYRHELRNLTNGSDLCLLLSMACNVSEFDSSDCAAEELLNAPAGGGVGTLANSQVGTLLGPDWHHTASFLQVEWTLEELFDQPGHSALTVLAAVQARIAPLAETSAVYRWCQYAYSLLGEPAMPVWVPSGTSVAEPARPAGQAGIYVLPSYVLRNLVIPGPDPMILTDVLGRNVLRLEPGMNKLDCIPSGVYFLRTANGASRFMGRVVKVGKE